MEQTSSVAHDGTEAELVSRILAGETALFEEVVRRHQDMVYGITSKFLGSGSDAEDAAQEVFLRAYRNLQGFKRQSKLSTWLYRIAYNLCTDRMRARRLPGRQAESFDEHAHADSRSAPEEVTLAAERQRSVQHAVDGLQQIYKEVVILHYYQGMSMEETAAVIGVPVKTVETRLYRARKALRARLDAVEASPGKG